MILGIAKETYPGERRVALVPAAIAALAKAQVEVLIESGAGEPAGFSDAQYEERGGKIVASRQEVFQRADVVFQVRALGMNLQRGRDDLTLLRGGQVLVGMCDPLGQPHAVADVAATGATLFALELIPRITRAQSMDVLSSMATVAGYRAVLLAAVELPKMFPMLMTAAGTISPARVFVIGAGVAGLQAIATAKRLGAVVHAYDVRPAVREQCESLGAKFVEMPLETGDAQDQGGYARELGEDFYRRQRELMAKVVAESNVVITTAAIPGKKSPLLITADAVRGMKNGSVIVDLAAERGGNCELTRADERVAAHGVTILGPTNLPAEAPFDASQMYANNCVKFLLNMVKEGALKMDTADEIVRETMVACGGEVTHGRLREALGLPPLAPGSASAEPPAAAR